MPATPHLFGDEKSIFDKYLSISQRYFEFGSGNSTIHIANQPHLEFIGSVENDFEWYKEVERLILRREGTELLFIYVDTNSNGMPWGKPNKSDPIAFKRYFSAYRPEFDADMIMIDGRFRVSCCLDVYNKINDSTVVFFHDFRDREFYHEVLNFYHVVESVETAVVLKKKLNISLDAIQMMSEKYAEDFR